MRKNQREALRREIEDRLLPFRIVHGGKRGSMKNGAKLRQDGWLRCIRQAAGVPVDEVARRMGVTCWEVHRLENSERNARIMLDTLGRAAKGFGCELVYALVPVEKTLYEMAAEQQEAREDEQDKRAQQREKELQPWLESIDWRDSLLKAMRTLLRREGIRVRPLKAARGVDTQLQEFIEKWRLVQKMGKAPRKKGREGAS